MKQILVNQAQDIIKNRRLEAERKARLNLQQALKDSTFRNLYTSYTEIMIENAKKEAFGESVDKLKEKNLKLSLDKQLKSLNLSSLEASYFCKKCKDSGIVENEYCDCLKTEISKILLENSGFEHLCDFKDSNFNLFENKEEIKKIYKVIKLWCNKKDSDKNIVCLLGQTGTGKTHLLRCMANEFINQGKIVLLTTAFNLTETFLKYHTSLDKSDILITTPE